MTQLTYAVKLRDPATYYMEVSGDGYSEIKRTIRKRVMDGDFDHLEMGEVELVSIKEGTMKEVFDKDKTLTEPLEPREQQLISLTGLS